MAFDSAWGETGHTEERRRNSSPLGIIVAVLGVVAILAGSYIKMTAPTDVADSELPFLQSYGWLIAVGAGIVLLVFATKRLGRRR